jgi:hypothetical protein
MSACSVPARSWRLAWPLVAVLALVGRVPAARADTAPGDSLLHAYVRSMSDSTDAWFGATAAPVDTAGLDSALVAGLARPRRMRGGSAVGAGRRGLHAEWSPALGFQRADGGQLGLGLSLRSPLPGRLSGRAQYTTGTHDVLGEGTWGTSWAVRRLRTRLALRVAAGRWSEPFDRDHFDPVFSTLYALWDGSDRHQYLRRDGFTSSLRLGGENGFARLGWRDQLESSLPYTTKWTLFGRDPVLGYNSPARYGRARELSLEGDATVPGTRFRVNLAYWTSDPRIGSDFRYRRLRASTGGDLSLGRHLALVPQATYGRLRGDALPQDALFLGGTTNLRTLDRNALAATGEVFARADLILVDDLRALLHLPLPAWLPLQAHVFAASGAEWGHDLVTGAALPTLRDRPHAKEWLSETGGGLSWRPGLPDPLSALRFEYAVPVGADAREARFTLAFQRLLNLLPAR